MGVKVAELLAIVDLSLSGTDAVVSLSLEAQSLRARVRGRVDVARCEIFDLRDQSAPKPVGLGQGFPLPR